MQRYYVLDVSRVSNADLPAGNLVSALIGLEKTRDAAGLREALKALFGPSAETARTTR